MKHLMNYFIFTFLFIPFYLLFGQNDIWYTTILKEKFFDKDGNILTGKGVVVGDIDSGIDIFNPFFFFADGGEYEWIDVNKNKIFDPGIDAVDLNKNKKPDSNESLSFIGMSNQTYGFLNFDNTKYKPDMDFLYVDANKNKKRDFGISSGFTEKDPTYGEQIFISIDANSNNKLDVNEKLIALKTSKVRAVREKNGNIRRRGVDLIMTEPDSVQHGTSVAGIILGGHYGVQKMHGIAPDAEIVMANIKYDYTPRFVRNFPDLIKFCENEKINILLFEDGEWIWEFMDGSSEEEQLTNELARNGIVIIGGGGNLASGNMHIKDTLYKGQKTFYSFKCPKEAENKKNDGVFLSFIWTDNSAYPEFIIETPDGKKSNPIKQGSSIEKVGKYNIFYSRDISLKGNVLFRFGISEKDSNTVDGKWNVHINSDNDLILDGYIVDVTQSWSGSSRWTTKDKITDETTVTFPSTADSCIAVGAYTVNFSWGFEDKIGGLCYYSGRGYNITGKVGIDLCAPGHSTFTCGVNYSYTIFSGTSSAAPHVVGAACLLLQYDPSLTHTDIRHILLKTAKSDSFTGKVPNTNWGYGKLDIENAIKYIINR